MQYNEKDFAILVTSKSISVTFNGNTSIIRKEEANYTQLLAAIQSKNWDTIPALLSPDRAVVEWTHGSMVVKDGQVYVETEAKGLWPVPEELNDTILLYMKESLDYRPLVKFAAKLSENPSSNSVRQLFDFLTRNNFTITEDGNLVAYKKITADFLDVYTKSISNQVGEVVTMPREQVDEDPNRTCSRGLHVANYYYAHDVYKGDITVFVEVHPRDVVSVPTDYNAAKMRVCRYVVLGVSTGEFKQRILSVDLSKPSKASSPSSSEEEDESLIDDDMYCDDDDDCDE